jgi:hypothetical protein
MLSGMSKSRGTYMGKLSRTDYFRVVRRQYKVATKKRKGELLDAACQLTGLHRKVVARHLRGRVPSRSQQLKRPDRYSLEAKQTVRTLWHAAGEICAERLHPFLPELLDKLVACGELRISPETDAGVRCMSAATVKRIIARAKRRDTVRLGGTTKPGSLLKPKPKPCYNPSMTA